MIPKGGNQNPYIEEEQTTQWPKEKVQKDKQQSTKPTYKTKDRVTQTPLKTWGVCVSDLWFHGKMVFSTNKTDHYNIIEIVLKGELTIYNTC